MENFSILIVDDREENIYSLKAIIEDEFNVSIFNANCAKDALEILLNRNIELILSDIQMPEIDGFQFLDYLKSLEKTKNIPVIFITGIYDKDKYKKDAYLFGAIDYISKPIDDELLLSKLKVYIDIFNEKKNTKEKLDLKNEILIHQSKMATLGEMIGIISHQLKQPLNNISLHCADVKDSYAYNEINEEYINEFYESTKKQISFMNETIDNFINFFNPNKEKKTFKIKDTINKTLYILGKQLINQNITLEVNMQEEEVFGVESELEQIFLSLIINAKQAFENKKYSEKKIIISSSQENNLTIITIEDTAGGVEKENIKKIFNPYFTTKNDGSGIGLYMSQLIIESSFKGNIKIENSQKGLQFKIRLPNKNPNKDSY